MLATLVLALGSPAADIARALGRPGWVLGYTLCVAVPGIAAAVLWVPRWRAAGAALALLIAAALATFPFVGLVATRLLSISIADLARDLARPSAALACTAGALLVARGLSQDLGVALGVGAFAAGLYVAGIYRLVLTARERTVIFGRLGRN
jgi:O-antigen/teichoic acid export membrane protein